MINMVTKIDDVKDIEKQISSDQYTILLLQDISKKLSKMIGVQGKILGEILNEADAGEYLEFEKIATTTEERYYTKELNGCCYVRAYYIENTGLVDISIGHNSHKSKRYFTIAPGDSTLIMFNRKVIRDIYIKTNAGSSTYILGLIW